MNKKILFIIVLSFSFQGLAQQNTRWSQYFFQPVLVNSAASGSYQFWNISAGFKSMWSSVPGAPKTQYVSLDGTILDGRIGTGVQIENDDAGLLSQKKVQFNANYRYRLSQNNWLSVGAGLGVKHHLVDGSKSTFETQGDQAIATSTLSQWAPATAFGVYFQTPKLTAGLSMDNAFRYTVNYTDADRMIEGQSVARLNLIASYKIPLREDWVLIPNILIKSERKNPVQIDITPMLEIKQKFRIGIGFRPGESTSLIVQNQVTDRFSAGYAYDFQMNKLNSVTSGSHELMLRYLLIRKSQRYTTPRAF